MQNEKQLIPQIFFESGYLLDLKHDLDHPAETPIAEQSRARVQELILIFDRLWAEEGDKFLIATVDEIGEPFKRKELSCTVTISPSMFSCSHPLILNARRFFTLNRFSSGDRLLFLNIVFHELLHRYLDDHFMDALDIGSKSSSPLMLKYAKEDIFTHAHMHLYALQNVVFRRLGLQQEWEQVVVWEKEVPNKGYRRAMEIVESDGAEVFVNELRNLVKAAGN